MLTIAMCIQYIDTPPRHELKQGAGGARYSLKHFGGKSSGPPWIGFFSRLGDSQTRSSKLLAFPKHFPAAVLSADVCFSSRPLRLARLTSTAQDYLPKSKQNSLTFPSNRLCFKLVLRTWEEKGEGCPAVFYFPFRGRFASGLFIYSSPSPNLQSWEQEPSGWVISVSCLWLGLG